MFGSLDLHGMSWHAKNQVQPSKAEEDTSDDCKRYTLLYGGKLQAIFPDERGFLRSPRWLSSCSISPTLSHSSLDLPAACGAWSSYSDERTLYDATETRGCAELHGLIV